MPPKAVATPPRPKSFTNGLLAHLILVPAWTFAPVMLLSGCIATGAPHGWKGIAVSLGLGAGLVQSRTMSVRGPLCLVVMGIGLSAPTGRTLAAASAFCCSFLAWLCKGGKADFGRRPAVWDFLSTWRADFYEQAELRGHLDNLAKGKSCFAFHPHGCLAAGFTVNGCYNPDFVKAAGKVNWLCDANLRYKNPFFRWMCDASRRDDHAILAADKNTFQKLMKEGENVAIIPGGFQDAVAAAYGKDCTVLKKRKGFIKYCLQYGYKLHPVYTFGESETFFTFTGFRKLRMKISEQNIPMIAFFGWPLFPILPRPSSKLFTYVGPALDLPHKPEPTKEDVDEWHRKYMEALTKLYNDSRVEAGWPTSELEIC